MRVSVGAEKVQVALAVPLGSVSMEADSGPAVGQALPTWPTPVGGDAAQPSAPLGAAVGPLQEKTV
jgi:hypothetical protein